MYRTLYYRLNVKFEPAFSLYGSRNHHSLFVMSKMFDTHRNKIVFKTKTVVITCFRCAPGII